MRKIILMRQFLRTLSDYPIAPAVKNLGIKPHAITAGAAFLIPRHVVNKPRKVYVDSIEPESLKKTKFLTKTILRKNCDILNSSLKIDQFLNSINVLKNNNDFKSDFSNLIFLEKIPYFLNNNFKLFSDQKFICNFYRENNFIYTKFWADFVVRSFSSLNFHSKSNIYCQNNKNYNINNISNISNNISKNNNIYKDKNIFNKNNNENDIFENNINNNFIINNDNFVVKTNDLFDKKPIVNLNYKNIFKDIKSNLADIQPSRLKDTAGFDLIKQKTLKGNRHKDYFGEAPMVPHPHFVLVRSQKNSQDMFGNKYCPISHGVKVGFSVLTSHISEMNRAAGRTGWGFGFGQDLESPLCCYVVVLANDYYITVKYQLNTLQLFNSRGTWNQAEYSSKKYYFNEESPNKKSAMHLCGFIEEAMSIE